jgi:hypothetical protein
MLSLFDKRKEKEINSKMELSKKQGKVKKRYYQSADSAPVYGLGDQCHFGRFCQHLFKNHQASSHFDSK